MNKELLSALLLGSIYEEGFVTLNNQTKIVIGDEEVNYNGKIEHDQKARRISENSIIALGLNQEKAKNYMVLEANSEENKLVLKEVQFFTAKLTTGYNVTNYCVVATDRSDAFQILKQFSKINKTYKGVISLLPSKDFFEPHIKE